MEVEEPLQIVAVLPTVADGIAFTVIVNVCVSFAALPSLVPLGLDVHTFILAVPLVKA